jgi:membrane peptidoglycan carboxypeptidase
MNSYGDPSSARGRAEADWPGYGRNYSDAAPGRATGSVPVGPAPAGRVSASARAAAPVGRASAAVAAPGRAPVGPPAGRATVGRASVRPISPAIGGPTGPGGPMGPGGPGGRGGGRRPHGPRGPEAIAKAKRRRRINWIIAIFAIMIMMAGGAVVGVTYYSTTVTLPSDIGDKLELSSSLMYAGGKQEIAKIGSVNRVYTTIDQIPKYVQDAVASAEDRKFYDHKGVDYAGIMRAAWNNLTGGEKQGASTITQQYARNALNLTDVTYARKAKEAVLASKLDDEFDKPQIMEFYLNTIYFGRGAYSIESASQAYFGRPVNKITVAEAAVLAAVIKQPVPSATHPGYDPARNPQGAKERWQYVIDGMVENKWLPRGTDPAKLVFPDKTLKKWDDKTAQGLEIGLNTPAGNAINYVAAEMAEMGLCQPGHCMETIRTGGFKITTSLDPKMQAAAVAIASRRKGSEMDGQRRNLMAALVSIDPKNGRVLAYYGGEKHTGTDYAGKNFENGKWTGGHPPGSSFKVYTLAAALQENISLKSRWDARPIKDGAYNIRNAGGNAECGAYCTLEQATVKSYNVPFFHVTREIGASKVLATARAAGITAMWDDKGVIHDVAKLKSEEQVRQYFDYHIGFGQYPVTVLEHTNGIATLAAGGVYNKAHFVVTVEKKNRRTGEYELIGGEQLQGKRVIPRPVAADVASTLQKIPPAGGDALKEGREAAGKTGTWQYLDTGRNAHAWMIGYTPQVATAVWVGNVKGEKPILLKDGGDIYGSTLPGDIWKRFMNRVHDGKEEIDFPPAANVGDDAAGNGKSPSPKPPKNPACVFPVLCPDNNGNGNGGNPGPGGGEDNGGGNGGNGGNDTLPGGLPGNPDLPRRD